VPLFVSAQRLIHLGQLARAHCRLHHADNLHEAQEKHRFWWGYAIVMCADSYSTARMQPARRPHLRMFGLLHVQMHLKLTCCAYAQALLSYCWAS